MKLSIHTVKLTEEENTWLAIVDHTKYDALRIGTPGAIKYGETKEEAHNKLKEALEKRGHTIIEG